MKANRPESSNANSRLSREQLLKLVDLQAKKNAELEAKIKRLEAKLQQLLAKNPTERLDQPYSEKAEANRQNKRGKKSRPKRKPLRRGPVDAKSSSHPTTLSSEFNFPFRLLLRGVVELTATMSKTMGS